MQGSVMAPNGWALVGQAAGDMKVFGPFDTADKAREACNDLGLTFASWTVAPFFPVSSS